MAEVYKNETQIKGQAMKGTPDDERQVDVHETYVAMDKVITDLDHEDAVQVPDKADIDLPIHHLAGPTPEEAFAPKSEKKETSKKK